MNVDEAIEIAASTAETVLATEVERLRAELAAAKAEREAMESEFKNWKSNKPQATMHQYRRPIDE